MLRWMLLAFLAHTLGCSRIVDPDVERLGGADSGAPDLGRDSSVDVGPSCQETCRDEVACTDDVCTDGVCSFRPDDARCDEGERCTLDGCVDAGCAGDEDCDDGLRCNGEESCEAGTCQRGEPVVCDDGIECTRERCDDMTGACVVRADDALCDDAVDCTLDRCTEGGCAHELDDSRCDDGFCSVGGRCTAAGCEDGEARDCSDGQACTSDTCSSELAMCISAPIDADDDGSSLCGDVPDCNDDDPQVFPGAPERCNGEDDDCDTRFDEGACDVLPDRCDTARLLTLDEGTVTVSGRLGDFDADYETICGRSGGSDAVYALDLREDSDYVVTTEGSATDTVLAVSPDCGSWDFAGFGCNDDAGDRTSTIFLRRLGASERTRRIYILLDGFSPSATGTFELQVREIPSANLFCDGSGPLPDRGAVIGHIEADAPRSNIPFACGPTDSAPLAREATFTVDARTGDRFRLHSADFEPLLYLRESCTGSQLICSDDDPADVRVSLGFGGRADLTLFVDGYVSGPGFYTLRRIE